MPSLKLSYFDGKGRAEPLRWILAAGKQKFDQETFSFAEWPAIKATTPYGSVPILYVDGAPLSQTVAIARYLGTISGLVASTPFKSAIGDEVVDSTAEFVTKFFDNFFEKDAAKKEEGEKKFWGEYLPKMLSVWEPRIQTKFLTDDKPTWADVFMGHWLSRMQEVRPDVLKPYPNLAKVTQNVLDLEGIKAYLAKPPTYSIPL